MPNELNNSLLFKVKSFIYNFYQLADFLKNVSLSTK